jgi:hypothetical protein
MRIMTEPVSGDADVRVTSADVIYYAKTFLEENLF